MTTEKRIQIIVNNNIPLDPNCETKRRAQILQRIQLRLQIEELIRELSLRQFEPRQQLKDHPQY